MIVCVSCAKYIVVLPLALLKRFIPECALCGRLCVDVSTEKMP